MATSKHTKNKHRRKKKRAIMARRMEEKAAEEIIVPSLPAAAKRSRRGLFSTVVEFPGDRSQTLESFAANQSQRFESFAATTSRRLQEVPVLLDSFTITVPRLENQHLLYQLLSSASIGEDDGSSKSPLKVVIKAVNFLGYLEGRMLFNCSHTKFLELKGFDLSRLHKTRLDNLEELILENVRVSKRSFPSCLANAHHLEKLSLKEIIESIDSLDIDISASNFPRLISLSFDNDFRCVSLQLNSATVQTFHFKGSCETLKVVSAPSVKSVKLSPEGKISGSTLEELISKFPSLESLYLNAANISSHNRVKISSGTLWELTLACLMEFEIDAPNLTSLTIRTSLLKINSTVVNVAPNCRCVFDCNVPPGRRITTSWFIELSKCMAALLATGCFRRLVFKLDVFNLTKVSELDMSQVGCCEATPITVQHLLMWIYLPPLNRPDPYFNEVDKNRLVDGLLWMLHPKRMSIARSSCDSCLFPVSPYW